MLFPAADEETTLRSGRRAGASEGASAIGSSTHWICRRLLLTTVDWGGGTGAAGYLAAGSDEFMCPSPTPRWLALLFIPLAAIGAIPEGPAAVRV